MIKTIKSNLVFKNQFVEFFNDDVSFLGGKVGTHFLLKLRDSVQIIPITKDAKIVLVEVYRYAAEKSLLELPAGGVDEGESSENAAERELLEETSMKATCLSGFGSLRPMPSVADFSSHQFIAWGCDSSTLNVIDKDEPILSLNSYSLSEVYEMVKMGVIEDMSSSALLLKFFSSFELSPECLQENFTDYEMLYGAFVSSMGKSPNYNPFRSREEGSSASFLSGYNLYNSLIAKK